MLKICVVEDEKEYSDYLIECIHNYEKEFNTQFEITYYNNGLDFLSSNHVYDDILFMDIQMPMMDGMSVAYKLRETNKYITIIFVTNIKKYVLNGYEVDAMDYLIKPIDYQTFKPKLKKAIEIQGKYKRDKIVIKSENEFNIIEICNITYIEVTGSYLTLHLKDMEYITRGPLYQFQEKMDSKNFVLCNSCYLVNLDYVEKYDKSCVTVAGKQLLFSRHKRKEFLEKLNMHLGNL